MEKSIESIWKQGFLNNDALVAPKLNNLYDQKSKTIIDKLKRRMKINIYLIIGFAFLNLGLYAMLGSFYAGLLIFFLLIGISWYSTRQKKHLKSVDSTMNSYEYLKAFYNWLQQCISNNTRVMRLFYPLIFLAAFMPIVHSIKAGETTNSAIKDSGFHLIYGIPTFGWIIVLVLATLIYIFGDRIYRFDVNLVYGRIFKKLESMIAEMEKLRN